MKRKVSLLLSCLLGVSILFFQSIVSHGFARETNVKVNRSWPGGWRPIGDVYDSDDVERWIVTYNLEENKTEKTYIHEAGLAEANCYFKLKVIGQFKDEIKCSPIQQFYLPLKKEWVCTHDLKPGDLILSQTRYFAVVIDLEFINEPIELFALEVEKTHNYFVGYNSLLTHNFVFPTAFLSLSVAFGEGAVAGGTAGSYFGPVTIAGGVVVGGLVGLGIYAITGAGGKKGFKANFNADGFGEKFKRGTGRSGSGWGTPPGDGPRNPGGSHTPPPGSNNQNDDKNDKDGNDKTEGDKPNGDKPEGDPEPKKPEPKPDSSKPPTDNPGEPTKPTPPGTKSTPPKQKGTNKQRDSMNESQLFKSMRSYDKKIMEHMKKLHDYLENPLACDNRDFFKKAADDVARRIIMDQRISELGKQIMYFLDEIHDCGSRILRYRGLI